MSLLVVENVCCRYRLHSHWLAGHKEVKAVEKVSLQIQPLDQRYENAQNRDLTMQDAPKLIWLGNGEVKPVRIQFYLDNNEVGSAIEIDHLGKINEI